MNEVIFLRQAKEVKFGSWVLELSKQTISDGDVERELEPLLFKLLCYFIINNEKIVTRQNLVDDVWCQNYVDDNAINRAMSELRKILKSENQKGQVVKTHYRKGYSFFLEPSIIYHQEPPLASAPEIQSVDTVVEKSTVTEETLITRPKLSGILPKLSVGLLALVAISSIFYKQYYPRSDISIENKKIEESVLSWLPGRYSLLSLSPNNKLIAFSFIPNASKNNSLVVKGLENGHEKRLGEPGINYLPLGWSVDSNTIYYRAITDDKCQVWRLNADFNSNNEFLFDCSLADSMTGGGAGNGRFIYSKTGYRNRDELAALTNRNLLTGEEFQITSPNLNSYGDRFLLYIPSKELILFERRQYDTNELYITDPDGGNQEKLFEISSRIWALNYDEMSDQLVWLDNTENIVYAYDLAQRKFGKATRLETEKSYANFQALDSKSLLLVSYPFLLDTYQIDLESNKITPIVKSEHEDHMGIEVDNGYLLLTRERGEKVINLIDGSSNRTPLPIPKGRYSSIRYNLETNQLLVQYSDKIEVYNYSDLSLEDVIYVKGAVISAEFLGDNEVGYVVIDEKKIKTKTFKYSIVSKKQVEVPALTSVWIGQLDESTLVSLASNDKIVLYDIFSGKERQKFDLPEAKYTHSITIGSGNIYHSDGEKVYQVNRDGLGMIEEVFTINQSEHYIAGMQYSEKTNKIILGMIEISENQLLQVDIF